MRKIIVKIREVLSIIFRLLLGVMWTVSGFSWLTSQSATETLVSALDMALNANVTLAFYAPFLTEVVLPNASIFAFLVSIGEFLTGISILTGTLTRIGALGAIFLLLNYSFMNGSIFSTYNFLFIVMHVLILFSSAGRFYGVDKFLHKKWPESRLF